MIEIKKEFFTDHEQIMLVKYRPREYALEFFETKHGNHILRADGYKTIKEAVDMLHKFRPNALENPYI